MKSCATRFHIECEISRTKFNYSLETVLLTWDPKSFIFLISILFLIIDQQINAPSASTRPEVMSIKQWSRLQKWQNICLRITSLPLYISSNFKCFIKPAFQSSCSDIMSLDTLVPQHDASWTASVFFNTRPYFIEGTRSTRPQTMVSWNLEWSL